MRFTLIAILAGSCLATAQSTSTCPAQSVLNLCVSQQQASTSRCGPNDYDCLCQGYTNLVVCYNNCPNDAGAFTASQNKIQYCQAASQYGSSAIQSQSATASISGALSSALSSASLSAAAASSTRASVASSTRASVASSTRASVASSISRSASASASSASAAATQTGAAANIAAPVVAGVIGIAIGAAALL
ncbi:hypothetical protein AUEXF2481DRAFT_521421 [Aureobasidium subglaciale EXF-2481]|uniref:Extracellular membrane protein CFEM domain-containing protein n=1 Tax=Aureobasidium subglaciale (strain EXF-2481) TaxID=1043005 RepID=A0A074Y9Z2_AURSE|nr:uncharacterized protein AUEXF2481DRAFT_521421 [Aureobasidium subglaciale EXF-2481]KAI5212890.1 hypothetical protein E4T38_00253 [Aureobasidium subglaciale]KAI5232467.1 hypothetical protein E4T40_00252 [Aureobasidium subglaciale]KAI5234711.1 hypothetical protein E4T41_00252 [Aureobasidium subglaciale]KAI5268387.1 hypothetical protein E4T46_00252 [Aureobasidium subglaciale]KEQ91012.1 hypothetical protein AUEXF2481DRAFT_521421 [Aureobasidium subglaciale EXF-2481]